MLQWTFKMVMRVFFSNLGQSSGSYHFFNLTSFGQDERVVKAEFRWFHQKQPFMGRHRFYKVSWAFISNRFKYAADYTLTSIAQLRKYILRTFC